MFTGLLIALLAVVGAATVVGGGLVLLSRRSDRALPGAERHLLTAGEQGSSLERSIREVRVGDIVQRDARDFLVEGVVEYDEDGHRWRGARLVDGSDEHWLLIGLERGGGTSLRWLHENQEVEVSGYPSEKIVADGATFTQQTRGSATATVAGDAGSLAPRGNKAGTDAVLRCRWWRYETAGDQVLVVEQWGNLYRVLSGALVAPSDIEMMPGS